ncbi:response regulator transcription factor [Flavobacterium rhizosphaerae]|uniref:Response regulator transcription factor n=1 Tax=Flavobacterium rhizosphaerae TaxID=3163298 RepID=A0ABW8YRM8_9FLAO
MSEIKVAITDDDSLVVSLLEDYLQLQENINIIFTAQSGEELLVKIEEGLMPEILLLDLKMEGMDGLEVIEHLKAANTNIKIIVVSSHYQNVFMGFMLKAGVAAFLPKGVSPKTLVEIIHAVKRQGFYFLDDQLSIIRTQISGKSPKPELEENILSEREVDVLRLICQQKTAKEIGEKLFITQRTAEGHKNNLFAKTGAKNIAGLVIYALQHQIISIDELPII